MNPSCIVIPHYARGSVTQRLALPLPAKIGRPMEKSTSLIIRKARQSTNPQSYSVPASYIFALSVRGWYVNAPPCAIAFLSPRRKVCSKQDWQDNSRLKAFNRAFKIPLWCQYTIQFTAEVGGMAFDFGLNSVSSQWLQKVARQHNRAPLCASNARGMLNGHEGS